MLWLQHSHKWPAAHRLHTPAPCGVEHMCSVRLPSSSRRTQRTHPLSAAFPPCCVPRPEQGPHSYGSTSHSSEGGEEVAAQIRSSAETHGLEELHCHIQQLLKTACEHAATAHAGEQQQLHTHLLALLDAAEAAAVRVWEQGLQAAAASSQEAALIHGSSKRAQRRRKAQRRRARATQLGSFAAVLSNYHQMLQNGSTALDAASASMQEQDTGPTESAAEWAVLLAQLRACREHVGPGELCLPLQHACPCCST